MTDWRSVPCKIRAGSKFKGGYGRARRGGKDWLAHRWAWTQAYGPIPPGMSVCHHCDVPACWEPRHLFLGTPKENIADCIAKGRRNNPAGEGHWCAKLSARQVREIKSRYVPRVVTQQMLADEYGISRQQVSKVLLGDNWATTRKRLVLRKGKKKAEK